MKHQSIAFNVSCSWRARVEGFGERYAEDPLIDFRTHVRVASVTKLLS